MNQETIVNEQGLKMEPVHRVVITGMGALSPAGRGVEVMWDTLMQGRSCIRALEPEEQERFGMTARIIARHLVNETGVTERDARAHRGVYGEQHMIPTSTDGVGGK